MDPFFCCSQSIMYALVKLSHDLQHPFNGSQNLGTLGNCKFVLKGAIFFLTVMLLCLVKPELKLKQLSFAQT